MTKTTQIVEYNVTDAAIAKMEHDYMAMTISDIKDTAGFNMVHAARIEVKSTRVEVEKKRKKLKASALEWGRTVDSEAKRIFGLLEPIESHLQAEEDRITNEKERIKKEKEEKEQKRVEGIQAKIFAIQDLIKNIGTMCAKDIQDLSSVLERMSIQEEIFQEFTKSANKVLDDAYNAVQDSLITRMKWEKEQEEAKKESERLEKIRAEQEKVQKKIDEANAKVQAQQDRMNEQQRQLDEQAAHIERDKQAEIDRKEREAFEKEAAEKARIKAEADAKAKSEHEAKEKTERDEADAAEKKRKELLRPDKERLINFSGAIIQFAHGEFVPSGIKDETAENILLNCLDALETEANKLRKEAEAL